MDSAEIVAIRQVIEKLSEQITHLDGSMSVAILTKSVLNRDEVCNLLIRIAEHKSLINNLK